MLIFTKKKKVGNKTFLPNNQKQPKVISDNLRNCKLCGTRCSQINQIYGYVQLFLLPGIRIRSSLKMNTFQRMKKHGIVLMKASLNFQ